MYLYLANWEWITDDDGPAWDAQKRDYCVGRYSLRSFVQAGTPGPDPQGWGLFAYDRDVGNIGYSIGDLGDNIRTQAKQVLANALGLGEPIVSSTPREILIELLTRFADPTGLQRWKPLGGGLKTGGKVILGDKVVWQSRLSKILLANTIAVFREDYRRNRARGIPLQVLRRWTGDTMLRLWGWVGDDLVAQLLPAEYEADGWERPASTIGDTFVEASDTALGSHTATGPNSGYSWTEVNGAFTVQGASDDLTRSNDGLAGSARAESALSSANHRSQVSITATGASEWWGGAVRFASAANTFNVGIYRDEATRGFRIKQYVNGTATTLTGWDSNNGQTLPFTCKTQQDSDDLIELYQDTTLRRSVTDSTITGNLYAGIGGYRSSSDTMTCDDFEAADLAAAAFVPKVIMF